MLFERVRTWQRMPADAYWQDFRRTMLLARAFMASTGLLAVLAGGIFLCTGGGQQPLVALGISLIGLLTGAAPLIDARSQPARRDNPSQEPQRYTAHRARWRQLHVGRTLVALLALLCVGGASELAPTEWIMLVSGGLWTGGVCFLAVERTRVWHGITLAEFLPDFRLSVRFIDPLMPLFCITSAVATAFFSHDATGLAARLGWCGVGVTAVGAVGSGLLSAPTVLSILRGKAQLTPAKLAKGRRIIVLCNLGRTVAAVIAFSCLTAAIVVSSTR